MFLDLRISAAPNEYKFDFGAGPVEPGYIGVSASTAYSKSRGYGFNTPWNMRMLRHQAAVLQVMLFNF